MRFSLPHLLFFLSFGHLGDTLGNGDSADVHRAVNPLYADLLANGLRVAEGKVIQLPAPVLTESLDAKEQRAALEKLAGDDYPLDELLRSSVVAPYIYKFRDLPHTDAARVPHAVDLWFLAHGDLDKLAPKNLQAMFFSNRKDVNLTTLGEADLKPLGLWAVSKPNFEEGYVYTVQNLLDRVQVEATSRAVFTRKPDSMVMASRMEPRFAEHPKHGNRWRSLTVDDAGKIDVGPPHPYEGVAMYVRITRLKEPPGAVFVEYHQVFVEPKQWFDGANLLRAKLPLVVQAEVRRFRRELGKRTP